MTHSIFVKGNIWTGDSEKPFCEAFFAENGKILACGSLAELNDFAKGREYRFYDYSLNLVMPGMTDSHIHATAYAKQDLYVNLSAVKSIDDIGPLLKKRAEELPEGSWIRAINFNEAEWRDPRKPDIRYLDSLELKNPLIVSRYCGHFHAVNSAALKTSGLWDAYDVKIARDYDGNHMGQLTEGAAGALLDTVAALYEKPEYVKVLIERACVKLASLGITALHACDAPSYALGEELALCQSLYEEDRLAVRWACYHDALPNYSIKSGFGNEMIFFAGLKLFADGTLGGRTCAMRNEFSDDAGNCGLLNHTKKALYSMIADAHKRGIQVQIHAIGDRALEETVECIESAIAELGSPEKPYRINHAIVCPKDLLDRIVKIGAVVDIQPIQAHTDRNMTPLRVGSDRMKHCYSFKTLYDNVFSVTGSSDAPIEDPNPWLGIWAAVNLTEYDGKPLAMFDRRERLSLDEAMRIYTVNPWKALGKEESCGKLIEGYRADFTVVDGNPFEQDPSELRHIKHRATFVGGKAVWEIADGNK